MAQERKQDIELGFTKTEFDKKARRGVLEIWTYAHEGKIISTCTVYWLEPDGFGRSRMLFEDFDKTLVRSKARATQNAIDTQHTATFTAKTIEGLLSEARAQYAGKEGITETAVAAVA